MRRLSPLLLALAGVLLVSTGASAASTLPNPESLRATLPDPVDSSWIEVVAGRSGYIDGPVTYDVFRTYLSYYQQPDAYIQEFMDTLKKGGFVGGYERQWVRRRSNDVLTERVLVFGTNSGAMSVASTYGSSTDRFFDTTLGPDATGTIYATGSGANFTSVDFVRGNASYVVDIGSDTAVKPDAVIPQARLLYDRAPASIALSHTSNGNALTRSLWLLAATGLTLLFGTAILVAVGTFALLHSHRRFVPGRGASLSP